MIKTTHLLLHAKITYIGVINECIIVSGDTNVINLYCCIIKDLEDDIIEHLFTDQPKTLMIDGKVSYCQFNTYGFEGIVSTTENTIWYLNFVEGACIRVLSPHFKEINDIDF